MSRIDRGRKFPATILLKALGYNVEELLEMFYHLDTVTLERGEKITRTLEIERMVGQRCLSDIKDPKTGKVLVKQGRRISRAISKNIQDLNLEDLCYRYGNSYWKDHW